MIIMIESLGKLYVCIAKNKCIFTASLTANISNFFSIMIESGSTITTIINHTLSIREIGTGCN